MVSSTIQWKHALLAAAYYCPFCLWTAPSCASAKEQEESINIIREHEDDHTTTTTTEEIFLSVPDPATARANLKYITSQPHVAGTLGDRIMANYVRDAFEAAGIPDVSVFELDVLLNYPQSQAMVELLSTTTTTTTDDNTNPTVIFRASLSENILDFDETSDTLWRNHTFHGYGASGNVTARMIYANYGRPQDFDALEKAGVYAEGTIVVVRYGKCFRGLKVMNAQKRGAVGVLIYSDPADDGYGQGADYPEGPWRPSSGVQRGSVQFNSQCAGDPMRADPRYTESVEQLCGVDHYTDLIPKIPSLPISYDDAFPLLQLMGGKKAVDVGGDDFCGDLDLLYTVGPSEDTVLRLVVDNKEEIRTIPNVSGYIPGILTDDDGSSEQDQPVLLGNHRDAWVFGAADPNSGTASLIEVARGLGKLLETGWRPLRSIFLLSWSGEEYGLLGSTGWAELNQDRIRKAVAYLNVDTVVSGDILSVSATPSLAALWEGVLTDLNATDHYVDFSNGPLGDIVDGNTNWHLNRPELGILGSGSDYTVFLDHFAIASMDFRFGRHTTYGQYHSIYDSFAWMDTFGGTDGEIGSAFKFMAFGAKIWGLLALRLADSTILPLDQIGQGKALECYLNAIENQKTGLDLNALKDSIKKYRQAAAALQLACSNGDLVAIDCNVKLGLVERQFLSEEGLPGRPWFKHVLQAPGVELGYAAEAFPGIQQAIDVADMTLAQKQVSVVAETVAAAATFLKPLTSH